MMASPMSTSADTAPTMISPDGARISYLTMGTGPAVIVIPGALSVAADYTAFATALAEQFTVHIIERRGRGLSSPQGAAYSIDTEREDVLALQRKTGASFLGRSQLRRACRFGGGPQQRIARQNRRLRTGRLYRRVRPDGLDARLPGETRRAEAP